MDRRKFLRNSIGIGLFSFAGLYPTFIERYLLEFNHYQIQIPDLPSEFDGFKILQISDLHYGLFMPLNYIKKIINQINQFEKDIIICTGDYVHEKKSTNQIDEVWPLLCELKAPLGVYSILGNHDHWANTERSMHWLEKSGQNLMAKAKFINKNGKNLWFAGAGDFWEDNINIDKVLKEIPESDCRILLAHNPDSADIDFTSKVDLIIAGHTHGGQVDFPFFGPPILPVKNKNYSYGLKKNKKGQKVFISKGIGWAIYPIRFNCKPEIPIIELKKI